MKSISVAELKKWMEEGVDFQLIDVREPFEFDDVNMGGILMPLATVPQRYNEIARDKKVVIHCKSGARSANAIHYLEDAYDFDNLYNLDGGIISWILSNK